MSGNPLQRAATVWAQWVFTTGVWFRAGTAYLGKLTHVNTADRTWTLPDKDGTVAMTSDVAASATTVTDTASLDLSLSGVQISGTVLPAGVDHNSLANLTTGDPHTQYALESALGTMSAQNANNVTISGGSVSGITDLAVADGGTGASTAADARTNLGLGTLATQSGTFSGTSSGTNTGDQTLASLGAQADAQPSARVYNNANISINDSTLTALTFNTERFDTDTIHNVAAGSNTKLTATTAGTYLISGCAHFAANGTGFRMVAIRLNGATYIQRDGRLNVGAGTDVDMDINTIYALSATDYVELIVYQNSGGALNILSTGNYTPEFGMVRLSS